MAHAIHSGAYQNAHHVLPGPLVGDIIVVTLAGIVTIACFVIFLWLLIKPGEQDKSHPKYRVLNADR